MPAITGNLQKKAAGRTALAAFAAAAATFGVILYLLYSWYSGAGPGWLGSQDVCLAAHAADHGVTWQQLSSDLSYQSELVAALSSCSGMAP